MSIVRRSGRRAMNHRTIAAAIRNSAVPTRTAGNAPMNRPSGHLSKVLPGLLSSGITIGPSRNSLGGAATICESHTHCLEAAMPSSRPSAVRWVTSAHGLNALTEMYG